MGAVEGALRGDGGGEQRLDALGLQHRLGLLGFGALQFRLRQRQARLHRAHASLQLIAVALVDQGREAGLENGHDLAGRDIFPDPVADAHEPPGHGRGDDVHITYPGRPSSRTATVSGPGVTSPTSAGTGRGLNARASRRTRTTATSAQKTVRNFSVRRIESI